MISRRGFLIGTAVSIPAPALSMRWAVGSSINGQALANGALPQSESGPPVVGYMAYGRGELGIIDQIAAIRDSGFLAVGFHSEPCLAPRRAFDPFTASSQEIEKLRQVLSAFRKVEVHGPYSDWDISLVSPNPMIRRASLDDLERHIDFATYIAASVFTTHPGTTSVPSSLDERLERLTDSLHVLARIAEKRRLLVCVETSDILVDTGNVRVFEAVKSDYLGITMDTGHISLRGHGEKPGYAPYGSIEGFIGAWGKQIRHVHLNDYNSKRDHIRIGQGELPLRSVLAALHRADYHGFLDMEVDPLESPAQSAPAERDLVRSLIGEIWTSHALKSTESGKA